MVIESKKWDPSKIRLTLDTRMMGDFILQTHFPILTSEQLHHEFAGSDRFSVLDMNHAPHQIELDQESQKLFVFTTPFGLYKYKRLVQEISPASVECHKKLRTIFKGLKGVVQIKDDLAVHGKVTNMMKGWTNYCRDVMSMMLHFELRNTSLVRIK